MSELNTYSVFDVSKQTPFSLIAVTDCSRVLDERFGLSRYHNSSSLVRNEEKDEPKWLSMLVHATSQDPGFYIRQRIPLPLDDVAKNICSAKYQFKGSYESSKIWDFFSEMAMLTGFFFALPLEDVRNNLRINLDESINEGYANVGHIFYENRQIYMIEPNTRFNVNEKYFSGSDRVTTKKKLEDVLLVEEKNSPPAQTSD